jgi:hypothetical protein
MPGAQAKGRSGWPEGAPQGDDADEVSTTTETQDEKTVKHIQEGSYPVDVRITFRNDES